MKGIKMEKQKIVIAEMIWDKYAEIIGSEIDDLNFWAGKKVIEYENFIKAILQISEQWISVKDKLPEFQKQELLAYGELTHGEGDNFYDIVQWTGERFISGHPEYGNKITHWMPLPDVPIKNNKK